MRASVSIVSIVSGVIAAVIASGCTTRTNSVQLTVGSSRGPAPLLCRSGSSPLGGPQMGPGGMNPPPQDAGAFLIERARTAGSVRVVLDYFSITGGVPGCATNQILDHCTAHCCAPVTAARACVEVSLADVGDASDRALADAVMAKLRGHVATADAPDGYVLVRLVATTESCDAVAAVNGKLPSFDSTQLVGCAYSCPVVLDSVQGTLALDLPTFSDQCETVVDGCAHEFDQLTSAGCDAGSSP